jgi:hypothetical protein
VNVRQRATLTLATIVLSLVAALMVAAPTGAMVPLTDAPAPAGLAAAPVTPATTALRAVQYANARGYTTAIVVMNTKTGTTYQAGNATSYYASESVVKAVIAARLLVDGQMHGTTEAIAYKMITQSDDRSADELYGQVGGDSLMLWAKSYFHITVGTPPSKPGWWGNTHISAKGLAQFYYLVHRNATIWPWLSNAMAHVTRNGSDGTFQWFGIPEAVKTGWMVKQGWGEDDNCACHSSWNSTGYVQNGAYAVVILVQGPPSDYNTPISIMITSEAQLLMPGAKLP